MNDQKKTQYDFILEYIEKYGSIDRYTSVYELGIFELPARICELEKRGYVFKKIPFSLVTKKGITINCKKYILLSTPKNP